jgi:DNA-binding PadR family transcriptional regulator
MKRHHFHAHDSASFDGRSALHSLWHAMSGHHHRHHHHGEDRFGGRGGPGGPGFGRGGPDGFGGRGGFGGGPGGFGGGGEDGMPRGRKFTSDDLQLLLLALLAEQPRHGYELIKALEVRSNGFYTPSPGMVYPALTYLEELGYATVELEGNRKRYALAEPGREHLAANRERVDIMFAKLSHFARKMDSVRRAFAGETSDENSDGDNTWLPEFIRARRALKHALLMRTEATVDEQRRIAAILARATAEIEGGAASDPV